jgi:dynein heavy chain
VTSQIAIKMLHLYLTQGEEVHWDALRQMIGDVIYGGRVTDDWDRRCMNAILDNFLCPNALNDDVYFDASKEYLIGINDQLLIGSTNLSFVPFRQ